MKINILLSFLLIAFAVLPASGQVKNTSSMSCTPAIAINETNPTAYTSGLLTNCDDVDQENLIKLLRVNVHFFID